MIPWVHPSA